MSKSLEKTIERKVDMITRLCLRSVQKLYYSIESPLEKISNIFDRFFVKYIYSFPFETSAEKRKILKQVFSNTCIYCNSELSYQSDTTNKDIVDIFICKKENHTYNNKIYSSFNGLDKTIKSYQDLILNNNKSSSFNLTVFSTLRKSCNNGSFESESIIDGKQMGDTCILPTAYNADLKEKLDKLILLK